MSAHSPGPWELVAIKDRSIKHFCPVNAQGFSLLTVVHESETPFGAVFDDADARLIAAAPELLAALQAVIRNDAENKNETGLSIAVCGQAIAAIAKATGGAP